MAQAVEEWYKQMPIITRSSLTAAIITTIGCSLEIISLSYVFESKISRSEYEFWSLITNFLYFGKMDLDFLFHIFFLARHCKLLEKNSFRGRTTDFFYMLLFGATVLTGILLVGGMIPYIYMWSKQNPFIHMSFLGLFTFTAVYLPWLLPEQAAIHMNHATKFSTPCTKTTKGFSSLPPPDYESYPENNSIKMQVNPILYCARPGNLWMDKLMRRLLAVLKSDDDLRRPSVLEALIHRNISIVRAADEHISMDLTQGIQEVLLMEILWASFFPALVCEAC
ncbi:hypothetical protein MKX03_011470 [Papaver bracteatum]|nr:hypothetical protein MKX03_011470 [Papaver bracteatum]